MTQPSVVPAVRTGGNDAIAFTSGPDGAPFAAGVIHAWLAADRHQPLVATGISTGALAAAAVRRVYEELEHDDSDPVEVRRWRWYQRYYQAVTANPLEAIWRALPDPVDFFSETPPPKDPSVPISLGATSAGRASENARRHFYLLVKLGSWLANIPVRVNTIATIVVMYVRRTEGYGPRSFALVQFYWNIGIALLGVLCHLVRSPRWVNEGAFEANPQRSGIRPLFGWMVYLLTWAALLLLVLFVSLVPALLELFKLSWYWHLCLTVVAWIAIPVTVFEILAAFKRRKAGTKAVGDVQDSAFMRSFLETISKNLDITKGLLHPYEAQRALYDLFVKDAPDYVLLKDRAPVPTKVRVKALFVCAALEETEQISLSDDMPVVDALTAAIAVPGLLPPQAVKREFIATEPKTDAAVFQVIDGAAVRSNPIPAFFNWCRVQQDDERKLVKGLERSDGTTPSLHVVYTVPTGYDGSIQNAPSMDCPDIVTSAQTALQLAKRRDTRQEVRQTNAISRLEWVRRAVCDPASGRPFTIFADEIAPNAEIDLGNQFAPDASRSRTAIADGCRKTMETLYRHEIATLLQHAANELPCATLLLSLPSRRQSFVSAVQPGCSAVCDHCPKMLRYRPELRPEAAQQGILQTYGEARKPCKPDLLKKFPQLDTDDPKVIFLGSGGVFRGAFHIGVLAAMYQTKLYPDLVVGASVGTLMGGALCRMTAGSEAQALQVLSDLASMFVQVDKNVSMTYVLKSATKQLGTRARGIRLSPSELSRKVRAGSKADPGYAATGAPPVLTDALSSLFTIPHLETSTITSQFIAGHFSKATSEFLNEVRKETLTSFDIKNCIMGVTLLEGQTRKLLQYSADGKELYRVQPYQGSTPSGRQVAFFGTTSFLNSKTSLLMGRDFLTLSGTWNAVQEGLCSSAFPAVFAARTEADLQPGAGRLDRYFADGGMFDNLPFFPAIEVLSELQGARGYSSQEDLRQKVARRADRPNLIISAGLNERPSPDASFVADTMFAVNDRAKTLSYESKTNTFRSSAMVSVEMLREIGEKDLNELPEDKSEFLNHFVSGTVVGITPTDAAHINPTFAFCKSLGMNAERIQLSIGDGCFRTLKQFSVDQQVQKKLQETGTLVSIGPAIVPAGSKAKFCPYYLISEEQFICPFALASENSARDVFTVCSNDGAHRHVRR